MPRGGVRVVVLLLIVTYEMVSKVSVRFLLVLFCCNHSQAFYSVIIHLHSCCHYVIILLFKGKPVVCTM